MAHRFAIARIRLQNHTAAWAAVLLAISGLLLPRPASPAQLTTSDALALTLDDTGAVTGLSIGGRQLLRAGAKGGIYLADVAHVAAQDGEMLPNGGFEQVRDGKPVGWEFGPEWTLDSTVPHSGKRCMKVSRPEPGAGSSSSLAVWVDVKPNTPYRVSMWIRTRGCSPDFYIEQYDAAGKTRHDYPQICVSHARENADWFELSREFVTPPFCRRIRVRTCLWQESGTAWIDDVSVKCIEDDYLPGQELVSGQMHRDGDTLRFEGRKRGIDVRATYQATADHIRIRCQLQDTTGRDRAISVAFRLPIDALGWTWHDDIHNSQRIEDGVRYGAARLLGPRRLISLYPFSAMGDNRCALALAVPMDQPRVFRLCYDARFGYLVSYEFGLTRDARKFPGRAWFDFVIYRVDPRWGFRDAAARYYRLFPRFFTKRVRDEGGAGFMAKKEVAQTPDFIMPAFAIFNYWSLPADAYRRELVKLFSYTEFAGWWGWAIGITPERAKKKPDYDEAWAYVEKLARGEAGNAGAQQVARCILNCSPFDRHGKRRLHRRYVAKWGGYNYICNPDPEVKGPWGDVNRFTLTYKREVSKVDTYRLDGMYYDCAFVFAVDNFRREHFQWADHPLAFDHLSKKPVIPMVFSIYECCKAISDDMHRRGKLVMSNYSVTNGPTEIFCIQFIDIIGNEMLWTWCSDAKLALQRTLAHRKTVSMSWQEAKNNWPAERVEREMKHAMFYGTFYYLSRMDREVFERWDPLIRRLAAAGWEPITGARTTNPAVMIERFGTARSRNLHFTVRNTARQDEQVTAIIDAASLGLSRSPTEGVYAMTGAWEYRRLPVTVDGEAWRVNVQTPAQDTLVLRVADVAALAADQLSEVGTWLAKADNYRAALTAAGAQVDGPPPGEISHQALQLRGALLADNPDLTATAQALSRLATQLAGIKAKPAGDEQAFWASKLRGYVDGTRWALLRAASILSQAQL